MNPETPDGAEDRAGGSAAPEPSADPAAPREAGEANAAAGGDAGEGDVVTHGERTVVPDARAAAIADGGLVDEVFRLTREVAGTRGRLPSLTRPPRRTARDLLADRPATGEGEPADPMERHLPGLADARAEVVDAAGTPVPEHLLRDRSIRIRRRRRDEPEKLGSVFLRNVVERGWRADMARGVIMTRWPEIVGDTLAEHVAVVRFEDRTLHLAASSTAWATRLRLMAGDIIARIAREVGDGVVEQVRIDGPKAPSWRKGRLHVRGRGPRDTYG
ncbi:DUF721 domain-containing protein [Corynebacterium sp. 335C]